MIVWGFSLNESKDNGTKKERIVNKIEWVIFDKCYIHIESTWIAWIS